MVKLEIQAYIYKLRIGLGVNLSNEAINLLADDILDLYVYESIEDIKECLKSARKGSFGWGLEKRGVINMMVIKYWMSQHLEMKARLRESEHQKQKDLSKKKLPNIDYEAYKKRLEKEKNKTEEIDEKQKAYNDYKAKFLADRQKQNEEDKQS